MKVKELPMLWFSGLLVNLQVNKKLSFCNLQNKYMTNNVIEILYVLFLFQALEDS